MSVDFYNPSCQETLNDYLFGLCDDQDGRKAYTNTDTPLRWTATGCLLRDTGRHSHVTGHIHISMSLIMNETSGSFKLMDSE